MPLAKQAARSRADVLPGLHRLAVTKEPERRAPLRKGRGIHPAGRAQYGSAPANTQALVANRNPCGLKSALRAWAGCNILWEGKSGRGLPHSKMLRESQGRWKVRQVLECASPLALWARAGWLTLDMARW